MKIRFSYPVYRSGSGFSQAIKTFSVTVLLLFSVLAKGQETEDYLEMPVKEGFISLADSVKLHYRSVGNGKDTLVVLHGGPGLHLNYLDADLRPLALSKTLIFYDQRTAGKSTLVKDTTRLRLQDYVEDLEAVRQYFDIGRLNLMGHSWGGFLAASYAIEYPHKTRSLLLVEPGPPPAYKPFFEDFQPTGRIDSLRLKKMNRVAETWADSENPYKNCWDFFSIFGRAYTSNPEYVKQAWGGICNSPQKVLNSPYRKYVIGSLGKEYDLRSKLKELDLPVLIIYGKDDPLPIGGVKQWNEAFKNSRMVVIENSGHFPYYEKPDEFFPLVTSFLEDPDALAQADMLVWPPAADSAATEFSETWWEITSANSRLEKAIAAQDSELATENYTEDAIFLIPTAPPMKGKAQIDAFFKDNFHKGVRSAEFQTLDIEGTEKILSEAGRYVLRDEKGEILDMGKYMVVWKKVDGKWRMHRDMFNTSMNTPSELYEFEDLGVSE
ncbi:alpha/beta fold hydrolase [Salegentibacter chungangensis]|uniref:Alpha/beta fold hydrolase n=1 Tax=Salegentibacter chungangensis TaxID=1335724 RepID=A0ABW3NRZ8_9FLAO